MLTLITLVIFFIILSILILVHEVGHFITAKKLGIRVEEFGFGLPPRIFGVKKGETIYSLNWLPFGGFVKLFGEDGEERTKRKKASKKLQQKAFYARPVWQKSLVLMSGVLMNFFLAVIIISYLFTRGVTVPVDRVHIEKVLPDSPASVIGLAEKDIIKKFVIPKKLPSGEISHFETVEIKNGDQLKKTTQEHLGEEIILIIERQGQELSLNIIPRKDYPKTEGPMGIMISNYEEKRYPWWQAPFFGIKESLILSYQVIKGIGKLLWELISFQPIAKVAENVAGPIGIYHMTKEIIQLGLIFVLQLLGMLSLNLAIFNMLPIPGLDGGRLFFILLEATTGIKVKSHWERYIHQVGIIILLLLMFLVSINDFYRYILPKW